MTEYTNVIKNPRGRGLVGWSGNGSYDSTIDGVMLQHGERTIINTAAQGEVTALIFAVTGSGQPANIAVGPSTVSLGVTAPFEVQSGTSLVHTFNLPSGSNLAVDYLAPDYPDDPNAPPPPDPDDDEGSPTPPPIEPDEVVVRVALVQGEVSLRDYFDGDTQDGPHRRYLWTGAVHNSTTQLVALPSRMKCGLYFGSSERMTWIKPPDTGVNMTNEGWGAEATYISGGAFIRRSSTHPIGYGMQWSNLAAADIRELNDYYDGLYGEGPFYFILPGTYENILPQSWATPRLACIDAPTLVRGFDRPRPLIDNTAINGHPSVNAMYSITDTDYIRRQTLTLPVPDEFVMHLGVRGSFSGSTRIEYTVDGGPGQALVSVAGDDLTNVVIVGPAMVRLSLQGEGIASINSMTAALSNKFTVPTGRFISGQGHSGAQFAPNGVQRTLNSAAADKWDMSTTLMEVEQWR